MRMNEEHHTNNLILYVVNTKITSTMGGHYLRNTFYNYHSRNYLSLFFSLVTGGIVVIHEVSVFWLTSAFLYIRIITIKGIRQ